MRIAILNWARRVAGGVESYLGALVPGLTGAGHDVALFCELDAPTDRPLIPWPDTAPTWCVQALGREPAIAALRAWRPDVLYAHAIRHPDLERRLVDLAPAVFFAHQYHGTCISGEKAFKFPVVRPCSRRFGPACLLHYFPHRCGGRNPLTMARLYRLQAQRLEVLRAYRMIATHSEHMRAEYIKHGLSPDRVRRIPYLIRSANPPPGVLDRRPGEAFRLVFVGRMERLKGGQVLLEALPAAQARLDRPLELTLIGDGRQRSEWQRRAVRIAAREPRIRIRFAPWASTADVDALYAESDLLVMPSVWPEPFGQSGAEAGRFGVPAAAFAVGGIPDWLHDGVNGFLAPGDRPAAPGLAEAIVRCLRDPETLARLRRGAVERAAQYTPQRHLPALVSLLEAARA